MQAAFKRH